MALVDTYDPVGVLKKVDDNIWIVDGPIVHMQQFGLNVPFPTRMTVIRLSNGDLFVHSPVAPSDALYAALDDLGCVAHFISPNKIHYASIGVWSKRYPKALCWASPGVRERAVSRQIDVHFDRNLDGNAQSEWLGEIDQIIFKGSSFMDEVVFFHSSSQTVILADLIENFERDKVSGIMGWLLKLAGNLDPDGKLPIDLRMTFRGRYKQACVCYQKMMDWGAEKVILSHGRWYNKDGQKELKRAFVWLACDK